MIERRALADGWSLSCRTPAPVPLPATIAATVPGCVHTDLLAAGLIDDPCRNANETAAAWIGHAGWTYQTTFDARELQPGERADIACDGLDTVAEVLLNGVAIGSAANMHRAYRFPAQAALRAGANTLTVHFTSAYAYAERLRSELGDRPASYPQPYPFIRKMASNFGWDWGPTLVGAGIWQPIRLETWRLARLDEVRPQVSVAGGRGHVQVRVAVAGSAGATLRLRATLTPAPPTGDATGATGAAGTTAPAPVTAEVELAPGAGVAHLALEVADPALWWPRGYGAQPRYDLRIELLAGDEPLDEWHRTVGFRSVRLDTTPDATGTPYTLVVNDVPVFVRGVNWIPDDVFPSRVTPARLAQRLAQACAANVNYLRVWGGGRYESDDFYDIADAMGLLVGQDFPFACAAYPEEEPLRAEVIAEASQQVARLSSHPSLAVWTGNNENLWGYADWGWPEQLAGRTWGARYYFEILPQILSDVDPTRPYWPGSPYSGTREIHPNDPDHGTMHIWDVWNERDYAGYRDHLPRYAGEFGYQAPATWSTLRHALPGEVLAEDSLGMRHHQKAIDGDLKLRRGLDAHLRKPRDFDDWLYLTQVNQARAVRLGIEHFRSHTPRCMGAVMWQLNDCWPAISWAAIDSEGRLKPLWYALRDAFADRLLTIQPRGSGLAAVLVNDSALPWPAAVEVSRLDYSGETLATLLFQADVPPRSARTVPLPADVAVARHREAEALRASAGDDRAWWFFAEDRDAAHPAARYRTDVQRSGDVVTVTVTAETFLRDLAVFPDRLHPAAEANAALVTLLPGESATFTITNADGIDLDALTRPPVLRCVNDTAR